MKFILNQELVDTDISVGSVALDFIRSTSRLSSTKEGCREGDCGACTVLLGETRGHTVNYRAVNSCLLPMGRVGGRHLVTLEGLNTASLSPIQEALVDEGATQCGFCTPGIVVSITGFLLSSSNVSYDDIIDALAGNTCRCTGYASLKRAALVISNKLAGLPPPGWPRLTRLIDEGILPDYFATIPERISPLGKNTELATKKPTAIMVAGGTDLYSQNPDMLLDSEICFLPESYLDVVEEKNGALHINGAATFEQLKASSLMNRFIPGFNRYAGLMASKQIRNRATLGGNIVNASPIGDLTIILLASDAELLLKSSTSQRLVPLNTFYTGYKKTVLKPGEVVDRAIIQRCDDRGVFNFEKVSKRAHLDIASVNSAAFLVVAGGTIEKAHLSAGGVGPIPLYLQKTSAFLNGQPVSDYTAQKAAEIAIGESVPIGDVRGSASYKRLLLGQLILAHFFVLFGLEGKRP